MFLSRVRSQILVGLLLVSRVHSHAHHHGHASAHREELELGHLVIGGAHFLSRDEFVRSGGRCGTAEPTHGDKLNAAQVVRKFRNKYMRRLGMDKQNSSGQSSSGNQGAGGGMGKDKNSKPVSPPVKPSPVAPPPVVKPTPVARPVPVPAPVTPPVKPTPVAKPVPAPVQVQAPAPIMVPTPPPGAKQVPISVLATLAPVPKPTKVPVKQPTQAPAKASPSIPNFTPPKIETWIHVITSSTGEGYLSLSDVNAQMSALNKAFASTGFSFNLAGVTCTANDAWYDKNINAGTNQQMKSMLRQGKSATLNIFFKDLDGLLGYGSMPGWYDKYWWDDGVVILPTSIPGGSAYPYDKGYTAVHEVGHWLGLYHTFDGNSCTGAGDHVADTPQQAKYSSGCPASKDSCPYFAGQDNYHNYMDYSDDACMNTFTAGQAELIAAMWEEYRQVDHNSNQKSSSVKSLSCTSR